jgi:DnaK suppressor protein
MRNQENAMDALMQEAKNRLLRRRAEVSHKRADHLEEERALDAASDADWPDRAAARSAEEVLHHQTDHEGLELREIDAALERIDDGTYGVCEDCGEPIPGPRLAVMPEARMCARCAGQRAHGPS